MSSSLVIPVRVTPRSKRDVVEGIDEQGALHVRVTAAPTDGAANKAVIALLAKALGVRRGAVSIVSGATSRHKRLRIEGLQPNAIADRWPGMSPRS